jgi:hypothetical protein
MMPTYRGGLWRILWGHDAGKLSPDSYLHLVVSDKGGPRLSEARGAIGERCQVAEVSKSVLCLNWSMTSA